jgi:hypothetical protein
MQHSHDNVFNILKTTKRCIDTCSKSSQVYMKRTVFAVVAKYEKRLGKSLSEMSIAEVENLEDDAIDEIS